MTTNIKAQAAWAQVERYLGGTLNLSPQAEYAFRRVGPKVRECTREFVQAFNESPIVDADEDTEKFPAKVLVRIHELKDGVR